MNPSHVVHGNSVQLRNLLDPFALSRSFSLARKADKEIAPGPRLLLGDDSSNDASF